MAEQQDIIITRDEKRVARLTSAKADKVSAAHALFGILPEDADVDSSQTERLTK